MFKNIRGIAEKFNWHNLVEEAITRRKEEGLNQKQHAALAGVSIPTMISFEKAETSISIEKVLAILDVVGLVQKQKLTVSKLGTFVQEANDRWFDLTKTLDKNSEIRLPFGSIIYAFNVGGKLMDFSNTSEFYSVLQDLSGKFKCLERTLFWCPTSDDIKPYYYDNNIVECWLGNKGERIIYIHDPSIKQFWRASKNGNIFFRNGFIEDSKIGNLNPGEIFDLSIPIFMTTNVINYAKMLAEKICLNPQDTVIDLFIQYNGLQGRVLANWSDPLRPFFDNKRIAQSDAAEMSIKFNLNIMKEPLDESISNIVHTILKELYMNFGYFELHKDFVKEKVQLALEKYN